jgi:hypothetical protein
MERTQEARVPSSSRAIVPSSGPRVVTLFTISASISLFLFSSLLFSLLPLHARSHFPSLTFVSINFLVITIKSLFHIRFQTPHLCQDGSFDAFQVASGHDHHSGDHGCRFGWYVSWLIPGYVMITY